MTTLILPLDGTPEAECAFIAVQALAKGESFTLRLLYVGDDPQGEHLRYLDRIVGLLTKLGHQTEAQVVTGDPAGLIVNSARLLPADLVIMKRDERTGIKGWVLGSITDKVARDLPCPLLLIHVLPGDGRWVDYSIERIMVPLDGSPRAERAIETALPLAQRLGARLTVMYSIPWLQATYAAPPELLAVGTISAATDAQVEADMHAYLAALVERYRDRYALEQLAMRGAEADAINQAAQGHQVDLIVMTTHGAGGIVHRGLGSVCDAVTRSSGVPVMLVRPVE